MGNVILNSGITNSGAFPVDGKVYFRNRNEILDRNINIFAYSYYERMTITFADDGTEWIWREKEIDDIDSLLPSDFKYPDGIVQNGIVYSCRVFNFFEKSYGNSTFIDIELSGNNGKLVSINLNGNGVEYVDPQTLSSDLNYVHSQYTPSTEWIVNHNLNKFPSVTSVDTIGNQIVGKVVHTSMHTLRVIFNNPISGKIYVN